MPICVDEARPTVRVTNRDLVAAMQILACIARPHRPASAGELMQQWFWARKRYRREGFPPELEIRIPDKDRIAPKLNKLSTDIKDALRAGEWLMLQWSAKATERNGAVVKGASVRALAARQWNLEHAAQIAADGDWIDSRDDRTSSVRQRIWFKRRPVAPMALAVRQELREKYPDGLPDLEAVVFDPTWVAGALDRAEGYTAAAIEYQILKPGEPWRFIR